jgi:hypothetical protein
VLYTYTIRVRSEDQATWIEYFRTAERCQNLISSVAAADSLVHRFCVIMEEHRLEVIRQIEHYSDKRTLLTETMTEVKLGLSSCSRLPIPAMEHDVARWSL